MSSVSYVLMKLVCLCSCHFASCLLFALLLNLLQFIEVVWHSLMFSKVGSYQVLWAFYLCKMHAGYHCATCLDVSKICYDCSSLQNWVRFLKEWICKVQYSAVHITAPANTILLTPKTFSSQTLLLCLIRASGIRD